MGWEYYRKGKLIKKSNDTPETIEDAVIELQENDVDVSDCVDDNWSSDYPPEEKEYQNTITFKPLTNKERKAYDMAMKRLKDENLKVSNDFLDILNNKIEHIAIKPTRLQRIKYWFRQWYFRLFR